MPTAQFGLGRELHTLQTHTRLQELRAAIERLQNGVEKIAQASAQVADLQVALKQEQVRRRHWKTKTATWAA